MAAVAGTKGRINTGSSSKKSFQMSLVRSLLKGEKTIIEVSQALSANVELREVGIDTNMVCNLDCSYCYLADRLEERGSVPVEEVSQFLASELCETVKLIAFIGKEPLADDRALAIMRILNKLPNRSSFRTGMVTNGTLVERRLDQLIDASPCYIDVSVDGNREVNDQLRGEGSYNRALNGIKHIISSPLKERLSTTTVLWKKSAAGFCEHAKLMFDIGVPTCFGSPVLDFAVSNRSSGHAVSSQALEKFLLSLAEKFPCSAHAWPEQQIMIDLPYNYTWDFLRSGFVPSGEVEEDSFEALFWRMPGSIVNIKLNPFSYSYFRALRVTHDGTIVENMDLAAHETYGEAAAKIDCIGNPRSKNDLKELSFKYHADFLKKHFFRDMFLNPHERSLKEQFAAHKKRVGSTTLLQAV